MHLPNVEINPQDQDHHSKKSNLNQTFTKLNLLYQDLYVNYRLETSSEYFFQKKNKNDI